MSISIVVGAGPVGKETARILAAQGQEVRLVSRSGTAVEGARSVRADAADGDRLAQVCAGAETIFMCAMAPYDRWPSDFPPIMTGVVSAAQRIQARLVLLGNVYGYGEGAPSHLSADTPLAPTTEKGRVRVAMWQQALQSSVPSVEVRASDYIGAGAASLFTLLTLPALVDGVPGPVIGDPDASHPWTYTKDVARTLVAASRYDGQWGRAFHVPSEHASARELAARFAESGRLPSSSVRLLGDRELRSIAREDAIMREVLEMVYLYRQPTFLDASETRRLLEVNPSPLDVAVRDTLNGRP